MKQTENEDQLTEEWLSKQDWLIDGSGLWWFRSNTNARIVIHRNPTLGGDSFKFFQLEVFCMTLLNEPSKKQILAFKAFLES